MTPLAKCVERVEGSAFKVGARVRQWDWLLGPKGYRDGVVVALGEWAQGTPHRWLDVEFRGHLTGNPIVLRVSSAQLTLLDRP